MEQGKDHIKQFSAADIEKYHKGLLPAAEMHLMEKAAMDDPFLADALEGYSMAGVQPAADLDDLKQRLANRTASSRIIPLGAARNRNFNLLRAAVILVFVAGAALLVYQFGFNNNNKEIAQSKTAEEKPLVPADSSASVPATTNNGNSSADSGIKEPTTPVTSPTVSSKITVPERAATKPVVPHTSDKPALVSTERGLDLDEETREEKSTSPKTVAVAPVATDDKNPGARTDAKKEGITRSIPEAQKKTKDADYYERDQANQPSGDVRRDGGYQQFNTFRGRVTDADNVGVPFANVSNISDNNAGTYTDAKGNFTLTYPDSVLNVQVRSIGFQNANARLKNNVATNQVILKDDRSNLNEVVLSKQTNTAQRKAYDNLKVEEPEPADGWEKYDAYLLNNVNPPRDNNRLPSGTVEISFEVNKNGEPTNMKVEKSLCSSCDKEALRLIKEGPKWKRNAKKGRTTVKIPF